MNKLYLLIFCMISLTCHVNAQPIELLKDIRPGTGNSNPNNFKELNGKLYVTINDSLHGNEIWMTDGTTAGTTIFADLNPGIGSSNASAFAVINGKMYFMAYDGVDTNLYITDGNPATTFKISDIGSANNFIGFKGKVYFEGLNANGQELWVTDGSVSGTYMIKDIYKGTVGGGMFSPVILNGGLYFVAYDSFNRSEIWTTDGTEGGTVKVTNMAGIPGLGGSVAAPIYVANGRIFFQAGTYATNVEWWSTDGTRAGTIITKDINPGTARGATTLEAIEYNSKLYFRAFTPGEGGELWSSDGTEAGTVMVKDINPGPVGGFYSGQGSTLVYNGKLYFTANNGINGIELWVTDGTGAGTKMVFDIPGHVAGSHPGRLIVHNNKLYFGATDSINGVQLWMTNGVDTTIMLTKELPIYKNALLNTAGNFCVFNKELYFSARYSADTGVEVYVLRNPEPENILKLPVVKGAKVFPNPVSDHITLEYSINTPAATSITLYDMSGRMVSTFISNEQRTAGYHTERLALPSSLAPGIYQLRLQCDGSSTAISIVKKL